MSKVVLKRLHARQLNGFRPSDSCAVEGLGEGLNIVFAPNRAGKSTLALAYRLMIGGGLAKYGDADVEAEWRDPEGDHDAALRYGKRYGAVAPVGLAERFVLDLPMMVGGLEDAERQESDRMITGGVRIPERKQEKNPRKEAKALFDAKSALKGLEERGAEILGCDAGIAALEQGIARASGAEADAAWLGVARRKQQLELVKEQFPGVEEQGLDAATRLQEILGDAADAEAEVQRLSTCLEAVAPTPGARPSRPLHESDRLAITTARSALEQGQHTLRDLGQRLLGAEGKRDLAMGGLATAGAPDAVFPDAARFVGEADKARRTALDRELCAAASEEVRSVKEQELGMVPAPAPPDGLRRYLEGLLAAREIDAAVPVAASRLVFGGALVAILSGGLAFVNPAASMVAAVVAAALVGIGWSQVRGLKATWNPADEKDNWPAGEAPGSPHQMLDRWAEVTARTSERKAAERAWDHLAAWLQGRVPTGKTSEEQAVEKAWNDWRERAGVPEDATPYELAPLFVKWVACREAEQECARLHGEIAAATEEVRGHEARLREVLAENGWERPGDRPVLEESETFLNWFNRHHELEAKEGSLGGLLERIGEHLDRNGVPPGGQEERIRELEARSEVAASYQALLADQGAALRSLGVAEPSDESIEAACQRFGVSLDGDFEPGIARARVEAAQLQDLIGQREKGKAERDEFERQHSVGEARAAFEKALDGLVAANEDAQSRLVFNCLLRSVEEHVRLESAPEVLSTANAKLERVDARLCLRTAPPGDPGAKGGIGLLLVDDARNGRTGQRFSQLATSAKVNVVLAIRLALLEGLESSSGVRHPVFADELMAVADGQTREGIARLLVEEAKGRQIVVLTNQAEDAWALVREAAGGATVLTIGQDAAELPEPEGMGIELPPYRMAFGPVAVDLARPVRSHAPGFLLTEPGDLAAVGDARTVDEALPLLPSARRATLDPVLAALEQIHDAVRATTRLLGIDDLENQDWITPAFRADILETLGTTEGRPEEFLAGVSALPRFRAANKEEMTQFLEEGGFLGVPKPTLKELTRLAQNALGDVPESSRWAQWCASRYAQFCGS